MSSSDVRLVIGIPTHKEYCLYKFFINFLQMKKVRKCQTFIYDDQPVDKCRNKIVKHAFDWGATHLLFLDDDMIIPPNAVEILLQHNKDVTGLLAFKRKEPFWPVIYKKDESNPDRLITVFDYEKGLLPVDATGCACMMIKMDVFRNLKFPWFKFEEDEEHPGEMLGEDFYFCNAVKEAGYSIYVDTFHSIGHLGINAVDENVWEKYRNFKYGEVGQAQVDRLGNIIPTAEKIIIE